MTRPIERMSETDRALISDLFARYSHGFDHDDVEELVETFTEDGVFDSELNGRFEGRDELRRFFSSVSHDASQARRRHGQHWINGTLFTQVSDGAAEAHSSFLFVNERAGSPALSVMGEYEDQLVKQHGEWRFARRSIRILADQETA
jgi:ketosteroid isomerase-like protein